MTSFEPSFSNSHNMDIPGSTMNLNSNSAQQQATSQENPPKKRLTYSRRGCTSCKQRRKKCSNTTGDGKMCWDCERLGKECIYIYNPKNVKRKTSPRKKVEKKSKVVKNEVKKEVQDLVHFESYQPPAATNEDIPSMKMETSNDNQEFSLNTLNVNDDDVNLIFQNLNDMVSMKLKDSQLNFDDYNSISLDDMFLKPETVAQNKNNEVGKFNADIGQLLLPTNNENMNFMSTTGNFNNLKVTSPGYSNYTDVISGTMQSLNSPISQQLWNSNNFNQLQSAIRETPINSNNLQAIQQQPSTVKSFGKSLSPHTPLENIPTTVSIDSPITVNTPLDSFNLGKDHDKYLRVFYHDCMDSIAPFTQHQINPLRDALLSFAKTEDYLLSSILAIGASISNRKKPVVNGSNNTKTKADEVNDDEKFYCQYLDHCLNLLSTEFQQEGRLREKIEPIILTVILLAWDCVYSMNSQWRSHLKGVTKLFEKIDSDSKILNLCKCWFKVIETFAHISTVHGGSLVEDHDLDNIFNYQNAGYMDSLRSLNVIIPLKSEFNLLRGHAESFDSVIKEVIKNLNHIRKSEKNYFKQKGIFDKNLDYLLWNSTTTKISSDDYFDDNLSYFRIQKILSDIDRQLDIEFINKSGLIPIEDPFHPLNVTSTAPKDFGVDLITLIDLQQIAISWYDISHQCQVLSFLLIVLLKFMGLPKNSIIIQEIVTKICGKFDWLLTSRHPPENLRTCYCNFAILLAGLNANQQRDRDIVRQYYKLNGKRFERLTKHNLLRLESTWNSNSDEIDTNDLYTLEGQDVLTW
ncbi:hypothetical protein ACO0R3_000900 [Hanseniaspora guilliermondii]